MVADEKGVQPEVALELLVSIWRYPKGDYVYQLSIKKGFGLLIDEIKERPDQVLRLPATCSNEYPVPWANLPEDKAFQVPELARPPLLYIMPECFII
jgi:hypothetical protein